MDPRPTPTRPAATRPALPPGVRVRPAADADLEAVAAVWNAALPMYPVTATDLRERDASRSVQVFFRRVLAETDDATVGFGVAMHSEEHFHPDRYWLTVVVRPEHHGDGIGRALYDALRRELEPRDPGTLYAWSREDLPRQVRFWRDRGFRERMRSFESILDLETTDLSAADGIEAALAKQGVRIVDLSAYRPGAPDHRREIYDLHTALDRDVPALDPVVVPTFERFVEHHFHHERFLEAGFLLAVADGRPVGMHELFASRADDDLYTGLTGVLAPWRGRGVATALKAAGIRFARRHGAPRIHTWNASNNAPMLAVNAKFGFVRQPGTVDSALELRNPAERGGPTQEATP